MAVLDAVPAGAQVFPGPAEARPDLRPFPGVAGSLSGERSWDAGRGAVHPAAHHHMVDAIPEARPDLKALGAGRLAVRELSLAGDGLVPAWAFHQGNPAGRLRLQVSAVVALCKQGADRFAA
jgi:hypothetical protein